MIHRSPPRPLTDGRTTHVRAGIAAAARTRSVPYWCLNGHRTVRTWAADAEIPALWDCPHCGLPAGRDEIHPPRPQPAPRFKTPLTYLRERRSDTELEALLNVYLDRLRAQREGGADARRRRGRGRP
jgi:hypothetical protein